MKTLRGHFSLNYSWGIYLWAWVFFNLLGLESSLKALDVPQENVLLVTHGPLAIKDDGDNDYKQVIYIEVPKTIKNKIAIKIFDPDCGGEYDTNHGLWNTTTSFSLYGGPLATTNKTARDLLPKEADLYQGKLIVRRVFGFDAALDNHWVTLVNVWPTAGEDLGHAYGFKLVVEGLTGDDNNAYNVAVQVHSNLDDPTPPESVKLYTYAATFRLQDDTQSALLKIPLTKPLKALKVNSFDVGGAQVFVDTLFKSYRVKQISDNGSWVQDTIAFGETLNEEQVGVIIAKSQEVPNDISLYVQDQNEILPISLPLLLRKPHKRPEANFSVEYLSTCGQVAFDGSKSLKGDDEIIEYLWDFGDGTKGRGPLVMHHYQRSGKYTAKFTVIDNSEVVGRGGFKAQEIVVNELPQPVLKIPRIGAPLEELTFSAGVSPDKELKLYVWDFGDGTESRSKIATHAYKEPGIYKVKLSVESFANPPCNSAVFEQTIKINAAPTPVLNVKKTGIPLEELTFSAKLSQDLDGQISEYLWDFGDGTKRVKGVEVKHRYLEAGTYKVTLQVTDNEGASNSTISTTTKVLINKKPLAAFKVPKTLAAIGEILTFNALSSEDVDGKIIAYQFAFGDGSMASGPIVKHAYQNPGKYLVKLTVRDNSETSLQDASTTKEIIINSPPIASFGHDRIAITNKVTFDAHSSYDPDGQITRYLWDFGDGETGTGVVATHFYGNAGHYQVSLRVFDNTSTLNNQGYASINLIVNSPPIADAGPTLIGAPLEYLKFSGVNSLDLDGEIVSYEWNFGDGHKASGPTVFHAYEKPGVYTVLLTVYDNCEPIPVMDIDETIAIINAPPLAIVPKDKMLVDRGEEIVFDASDSYDPDGNPLKYTWNFSDGLFASNQAKVKRSFKESGVYVANLTVDDQSGVRNSTNATPILVRVNYPPVPNPGPAIATCDMSILFDGSASFDADGDRLSYLWDFGDHTPKQTGVKVYHTYAQAGNYPVVLTVDDNTDLKSSKQTASLRVFINKPPIADAGGDKNICAGEMVLFNGSGSKDPENGPLKYLWDLGEGLKASGVSPSRVFTKGGVYTVRLTVEDDSGLPCNRSTDQITVKVAESPVAIVGPDQSVCANTEVQFDGSKSRDADGLVNAFSWDFGDGQSGGGPQPTHVYAKPGKYTATLTVTGDKVGDCNNTAQASLIVTVYDAPIVSFKVPKVFPVNTPLDLAAEVAPGSYHNILGYHWDLGNGEKPNLEKFTYTYRQPGKYLITLKVISDAHNGCNTTTVQNLITVNAPPVAKFHTPKLVAVNEAILFSAQESFDPDGSLTSYRWNFGDGTEASGVQIRHAYKQPGTYRVRLKVVDDTEVANNTAFATSEITVNAEPQAWINDLKAACVNEDLKFSAAKAQDPDGQIVRYSWSFGDGATASSRDVHHRYSSPGRYQVSLTVDDGRNVLNSKNQANTTVVINAPPVADAGEDVNACPLETITFSAANSFDTDGRIESYLWDFGDGTQATGLKVTHAFKNPGNYQVKLTVIDDSLTTCRQGEAKLNVFINAPPVAVIRKLNKEVYAGGTNESVLFDGTHSEDPDGGRLEYFWDFADGTLERGAKIMHNFTAPGEYIVKLRVKDTSLTKCNETSQTLTVEVKTH